MKPIIADTLLHHHTCDEALWADFKSGDREAFALLYYRYFAVLVQRAVVLSDDKDLIKDCIHDLFIDIWKHKHRLTIPHSVKAYLIRSLQRKVIRQVKKTRQLYERFNSELHSGAGIVHSVEKKIIAEQLLTEKRQNVMKALETLTRRQKEAVYLKFYANLSYQEIAGKMSISTDAIYNLISKAIGSMQHRCSKVGY